MTSAEPPTPIASPPSSPRLPVELLAQIVDEAAGDRDHVDYTTLRHLCLSSRSILPFARQALYREVRVTFQDVDRDLEYRDPASFDPDGPDTIPDGAQLQAALEEAPHLASLVRTVCIHFANDYHSAAPFVATTTAPFLEMCRNIKAFRASGAHVVEEEASSIAAELSANLPDLVHLSIGLGLDTVLLLSRTTSLKHLHLFELDEYPYAEFIWVDSLKAVSFAFKLVSLQWDISGHPQLFSTLTRSSASSLARLRCVDEASSDLAPHLTAFTHLCYLEFADHSASPGERYDAGVLAALSSLPHLLSLRLSGVGCPLALLSHLPLNLEAISCDGPGVNGAMFKDLLLDKGPLSLGRVVIEDNGWVDWGKLGAEHGWQVERFGEKVVLTR